MFVVSVEGVGWRGWMMPLLAGLLAACQALPGTQPFGLRPPAAAPASLASASGAPASGAPASAAPASVAPASLASASGAPASAGDEPAGQAAGQPVPTFSHVWVIVLENHTFGELLGTRQAPALTALAGQGAVAEEYYAIAHPSEPNYLALIAGSSFGVNDDSPWTSIAAPTIVDQLLAAGRSWKAYMQGLPAPGSPVPYAGRYAIKHDPFMLFSTITQDPRRARRVAPLQQLYQDVSDNQAPDYSFITPDSCNDMHDCAPFTGDQFTGQLVRTIEQSPVWDSHSAIFVVFDEADSSDATCCGTAPGGGKVGALVLSPLARAGFVSTRPYNHYSLLRTIEAAWRLGTLGHTGDPGILPMSDLFQPG